MSYERIARKLAKSETIIIDGGTGTDIQSRGVPMAGETWCAEANLTHPAVVRCVHEDYIAAGAEIVTANTYPTSPLLFNALGRDQDMIRIDKEAVRIAHEASDGRVAVAGSFSVMRPMEPGVDRVKKYREWSATDAKALMRRKAESMAEANVDLIMMEMMRDADYSLWATEAAVATGLPVWVGIATEPRDDGRLTGFARPDWLLEDVVKALAAAGADVISIMHTLPNHVGDALKIVRAAWQGPLGAYPESGFFKMPDWQFVDIIEPSALVAHARDWQTAGASIFGGCCGTNPQHIKALSTAFRRAA
ncbi:MAG: homocysteine S-methyltransferase family protein [Parvibaculaceae bacterium]